MEKRGEGLVSQALGGHQIQTQITQPSFGANANNQYGQEMFKPNVTTYNNTPKTKAKGLTGAQLLSIGLAAGGLGTAAYQTGKAIAAKHRTTAKGHAKAVAKRDAWKREMNEVFKGTAYDANRATKKKRRR